MGLRTLWTKLFSFFDRQSDAPLRRLRREGTLMVAFILLLLFPVATMQVNWGGAVDMDHVVWIVGTLLMVWTVGVGMTKSGWSDRLITAFALQLTFLILVLDLRNVSNMTFARSWPLVVVVLDMMLLCEVPRRKILPPLFLIVAWLLIIEAELVMRFGLFDLPGTMPYADRSALCDCVEPPCATKSFTALQQGLASSLPSLLVDFFLTHRFAQTAIQQRNTVQASVVAATEVAQHLATFDLDGAKESLARYEGTLPQDLSAAFQDTLHHLSKYRAYLPMACLVEADVDDSTVHTEDHVVPFVQPRRSRASQRRASELAQEAELEVPDEADDASGSPSSVRLQSVHAPSPRMGWDSDADIRRRRITVVVLNMPGSLGRFANDLRAFLTEHSSILTYLGTAVQDTNGIVDRFIGDRFHVCFNASRKCSNHGSAAVKVAKNVVAYSIQSFARPLKCAVASGVGVCGSLGDSSTRSHTVLGPLFLSCNAILRACKAWDMNVLCTSATRQDAWHEHEMRICLHKVLWPSAIGPTHPVAAGLFHCVPDDEFSTEMASAAPKNREVEWLYDMGSQWDVWNQAGHLLLLGSEAAAQVVIQGDPREYIRAQFAEEAEKMGTVELVI